jgi:hypothetical protein
MSRMLGRADGGERLPVAAEGGTDQVAIEHDCLRRSKRVIGAAQR